MMLDMFDVYACKKNIILFLLLVIIITPLLLGEKPKGMVYDDGCRFDMFKNNMEVTDRANYLNEMDYIVDRLHIKGHIKECQDKYHPNLFPYLNNKNTQVCEQANYWLGKFKYMCKHMGNLRYNFFLIIMCDMWNYVKQDGRINVIETFKLDKVKATFKRKYHDNTPLE